MSIGWVAMSASLTFAQDLSRYRDFHLGMSLEREQNQTEENRLRQQTARRVNKATFRP